MENRLNILAEGLDQKIHVLEQIQVCNTEQEEAFLKEEADLEAFDSAFDKKDKLIDELTRLDEGFEALYEEIAQKLQESRGQYTSQIKQLQAKITRVTELSVSIQAQEARNKKLMEDYFVKSRNGIKQNKQTSRAAYDYYKSMSGTAYSTSRFMDNKQ